MSLVTGRSLSRIGLQRRGIAGCARHIDNVLSEVLEKEKIREVEDYRRRSIREVEKYHEDVFVDD